MEIKLSPNLLIGIQVSVFCYLIIALALPLFALVIVSRLPQFGEMAIREFGFRDNLVKGIFRVLCFYASFLFLLGSFSFGMNQILEKSPDVIATCYPGVYTFGIGVLLVSAWLILCTISARLKQCVWVVRRWDLQTTLWIWGGLLAFVSAYAAATVGFVFRPNRGTVMDFLDPIIDRLESLPINPVVPYVAWLLVGATLVILGRIGVRVLLALQGFSLTWINVILSCILLLWSSVLSLISRIPWVFITPQPVKKGTGVDILPLQGIHQFALIAGLLLLVGVGVIVVSLIPWDTRRVGRARNGSTAKDLQEQIGKWRNSDKKKPMIIVVAEGGGVHATVRTLQVLAKIADTQEVKFWDSWFASSTVSGGSIGAGVFLALSQYPRAEDERRVAIRAHRFAAQDLLLPSLFGLLVIEPLALVCGFLSGLDRAKTFQHAIAVGVERALLFRREFRTSRLQETGLIDSINEDEQAYLDKVKSNMRKPVLLMYQATSTGMGVQMGLSRLKMTSWRSLASLVRYDDLNHLEAMCLSARYPIISPYGRILAESTESSGCSQAILNCFRRKKYEGFVDGGVVDNSGLLGCKRLCEEIRALDSGANIKIIVIGNIVQETDPNSQLLESDQQSTTLAFLKSAAQTLLKQNAVPSREFKLYCSKEKIEVAEFRWNPEVIRPPLGWYMSEPCRKLIGFSLGLDEWFGDKELFSQQASSVAFTEDFLTRETKLSVDQQKHVMETRLHNLEMYSKVGEWLSG